MTQYRITRKNSRFGWSHKIQYKYFGLFWANISQWDQSYNEFDLKMTKWTLERIVKDKKEFAERKKIGNSVV